MPDLCRCGDTLPHPYPHTCMHTLTHTLAHVQTWTHALPPRAHPCTDTLPPHSHYTRTCTLPHTCTHSHMHTLPHTYTHSLTHAHSPSHMHTLPHTCTHSLTHTHTPSHMHTLPHTCTLSLTHTHTPSHMHTLPHTYTHSLTHAHTPSHMHTLPHTYTHSLTHTHTPSHMHTLPHTYTLSLTHAHTPSQVIALLALALVAGFSGSTSADCRLRGTTQNASLSVSASYPFGEYTLTTTLTNISIRVGNSVNPSNITQAQLLDASVMQSAQFFVTWGSFTMIYSVVAILVYMFVTANEQLEKVFDFLVYCVSGCGKL